MLPGSMLAGLTLPHPCMCWPARSFFRCFVQMSVYPVIRAVQPNFGIPSVSQLESEGVAVCCSGCRSRYSDGVISSMVSELVEILRNRKLRKSGLVPPVAEEFCIIGRNDYGDFIVHDREMLDLFFTAEHEIPGVFGSLFPWLSSVVRLFVHRSSGDPVVLDARVGSQTGLMDVRLDILKSRSNRYLGRIHDS